MQAVRRDFGLDHRDRGRRAVFFEDLPQQDFRGRRATRQLGQGREAVAIDMGEEKAAAVFGGSTPGMGISGRRSARCRKAKGSMTQRACSVLGTATRAKGSRMKPPHGMMAPPR